MNAKHPCAIPLTAALLALLAWALPHAVLAQEDKEEAPRIVVTRAGDLYNVASEGASLGDVLAKLEAASGVSVEMPADLLKNPVTVKLKDASYERVVQALAGSHALVYEQGEDGEYRLVSAKLTSQQDAIEVRDLSREERRNAKRAQAEVKRVLEGIQGLYGYAGVLDYDAAKKLVGERQAKFDQFVKDLAALGEEGAFAMRDLYGEMDVTRQRLAMVLALRSIDSADASSILGSLYQGEPTHSLQREIIGMLGYRADALDVILSIRGQTDDRRLKAAATMALAGRPGAQSHLMTIIGSLSEDPDVRKEAVRSLGEIKSDEARDALASVALGPLAKPYRLSAIQELARTFGAGALGTFEVLLSDPDEAVRVNAVKAVSRVGNAESTALLLRVIEQDPSEAVRAHARARMPDSDDE